MDEKTIYRLQSLIGSSMFKLNHLWDGATGSDHAWLCGAYKDLTSAFELLEKEVNRLEDDD